MGRGMVQRSKDLIDFMYTAVSAIQPVTSEDLNLRPSRPE
jgi:hypothetical protein